MIKTKSVRSPIERGKDGLRILVTRFRGRRLPVSRYDVWMANLGPSEELLRGFLTPQLFERGLICRADDRGDPVIQISPPLVAGPQEFAELTGILGDVLAEAWQRTTGGGAR